MITRPELLTQITGQLHPKIGVVIIGNEGGNNLLMGFAVYTNSVSDQLHGFKGQTLDLNGEIPENSGKMVMIGFKADRPLFKLSK